MIWLDVLVIAIFIFWLLVLIALSAQDKKAAMTHTVTTLPQPGPPAHWPGCEQEGCNCWTCGKHYLCPKGSHR